MSVPRSICPTSRIDELTPNIWSAHDKIGCFTVEELWSESLYAISDCIHPFRLVNPLLSIAVMPVLRVRIDIVQMGCDEQCPIRRIHFATENCIHDRSH